MRDKRPSFKVKRSPRQVTVCPAKLVIHTKSAVKSRSGINQIQRATCRSCKTSLPTTNDIAKRTPAVRPSRRHAQVAPLAEISARIAQGKPKVRSKPVYPHRRESRMQRAQRS